jgi:hypothetical protein
MEHRLAGSLAESVIERRSIMFRQEISHPQLSTIFVYPLRDLFRQPTQISLWTLYPAAYPIPGNNEVNFLPRPAAALSLKITVFNCAIEVTCSHQPPSRLFFLVPFAGCSSIASQSCRPVLISQFDFGGVYGVEEGEFEDACGAGADDPGERIFLADRLGAAGGRLDHGHGARS